MADEVSPLVACYLGLGSNIGDRVAYLSKAIACICSGGDVVLRRLSNLYLTRAWGMRDQPDFVNAAIEVETHLGPKDLLERAMAVERGLGRRRGLKWGPREVDIDILFYGREVVIDGDLRIPHPGVCERGFVLAPLCDIAPDLVHPETGHKVSAHLECLRLVGDCSWTNLAI